MDEGAMRFINNRRGYSFLNNEKEKEMAQPERCQIRIYGNQLGTTYDIISLWNAIEKNYISILAYEKLISMFSDAQQGQDFGISDSSYIRAIRLGRIDNYRRSRFMDHFEKYSISDIVSLDDYPLITRINFNSPGFWEVLGQWNIFVQLRKFIQECHLRKKDKNFGWENEKHAVELKNEEQQLHNDLLKLEITQKMIKQLQDIGLSDVEIRCVVQKCYENMSLLHPHIEDERIVDIQVVNEE